MKRGIASGNKNLRKLKNLSSVFFLKVSSLRKFLSKKLVFKLSRGQNLGNCPSDNSIFFSSRNLNEDE